MQRLWACKAVKYDTIYELTQLCVHVMKSNRNTCSHCFFALSFGLFSNCCSAKGTRLSVKLLILTGCLTGVSQWRERCWFIQSKIFHYTRKRAGVFINRDSRICFTGLRHLHYFNYSIDPQSHLVWEDKGEKRRK